MSLIQEFQKKIDSFLEEILDPKLIPTKIYPKIIHDSVWGTKKFYSWEIGLIDSPILQRLRRIHQTGLAFLVFPTATHTRFEHSLGVTVLVEDLVSHLNINKKTPFISKEEKFNLRLSALLHDIGHSFFSHISEMVYDRMPIFQDFLLEINEKFEVVPKGHELFSFLMIRSEVFQSYFNLIYQRCVLDDNLEFEDIDFQNINWDLIAGWIIGYSQEPDKMYLKDIINGPIDCDKLDYLARDAKFAGPAIVYDIDRFFYTLNTIKIGKCERLTVTLGGITALEQILISRMMMYSYIYHHHKVRSAEAMIKRLCFDIMNDEVHFDNNNIRIKLEHPVDFLNFSDEVILNSKSHLYNISNNSKHIIKNLLNRELWHRSILISGFNTDNGGVSLEYKLLERDLHLEENKSELRNLKDKIINEVRKIDSSAVIESRDIWIDVPVSPKADAANTIKIKRSHDSDDQPMDLFEVFPLSAWIAGYEAFKWRSHIFCMKRHKELVYKASKKVLYESYNLNIQDFTAYLCKITD